MNIAFKFADPEPPVGRLRPFAAVQCCPRALRRLLPAFGLAALLCCALAQCPVHAGALSAVPTNSPAPALSPTNAPLFSPTLTMDTLDDKHKLVIGDRLSYQVIEDDDLTPKELTVADSGELQIPLIGRCKAEGKTCKDVADLVKTELEKKYYYHATVIIAVDAMSKSRGRVYLAGPVHLQGAQDLPSDEDVTLSKAILRAGGFGDWADKKHVELIRPSKVKGADPVRTTYDVDAILSKGKTETDPVLQPDDYIIIHESHIRF